MIEKNTQIVVARFFAVLTVFLLGMLQVWAASESVSSFSNLSPKGNTLSDQTLIYSSLKTSPTEIFLEAEDLEEDHIDDSTTHLEADCDVHFNAHVWITYLIPIRVTVCSYKFRSSYPIWLEVRSIRI